MNLRDQSLDYLKLVAIVAVIFNHSCNEPIFSPLIAITRFGNHAFAALSCFFAFRSGLNSLSSERVRWMLTRATALYSLFIVWNLIAFAARSLNSFLAGAPSPFTWSGMFLSGFTHGLWFLPFISVANSLAFSAGAAIKSYGKAAAIPIFATSLLIAAVLATSHSYAVGTHDIYLFSISRKNVPTCLAAVAVSTAYFCFSTKILISRTATALWGGVGLVGAIGILFMGRSVYLWETLMGTGVMACFMNASFLSRLPALNPLLSIWYYVAHGVVLHGLKFLLVSRVSPIISPYFWVLELAVYITTVLTLSALFFITIRSNSLQRLLFPNVSVVRGFKRTVPQPIAG